MFDKEIENQKKEFTPEEGFNLVGIDYLENSNGQLYFIGHFDLYQEALSAKKNRKNPDEYLILYKGTRGEYLSR